MLSKDKVFALLENTRFPDQGDAFLFTDPVEEVISFALDDVEPSLDRLDQLRTAGYYLCGYLAYEAGYALTDKDTLSLAKRGSAANPILHFYAFEAPQRLSANEVELFLEEQADTVETAIKDVTLNMSEEEYSQAIERVRGHIREGDTYQINFTQKYRFNYQGSPIGLYSALRDVQSVEFSAFLNFPEYAVVSLSPELFIEKRCGELISRPMKGTFPRGASLEADAEIVEFMKNDPKTLSENVMIVDLMRNDISRIAKPGSVRVENLFEVQRFQTLHQMVSTVKADVHEDIAVRDLIGALFPCGSITGAPKLRTMELIRSLEVEPRGLYTGAIGYITPENDFCFNVPIRTCLAYRDGSAEMGVGGGILYESDARAEYQECLLKGKFLTQLNSRFQLIEAILFDAEASKMPLLELHIQRLQDAAQALHFQFDIVAIRQQLLLYCADLRVSSKLRLLLDSKGACSISSEPLALPVKEPKVNISSLSTDSNEWLYSFKTTFRTLYNSAYEEHAATGAYDVLFLNELGHVSESSRHNLFIELGGQLITPPISDAVLRGVYRQWMLENSEQSIEVRSISPQELLSADAIYLTNAVRGMVKVSLSAQAQAMIHEMSA